MPASNRSMHARARQVLRVLGFFASALALAWIVSRFLRGGGVDVLRELPIERWQIGVALLAGAVAYAVASMLLALAWWRMLVAFSPAPPPFAATVSSYAVTQYGRYLPGNVAHYVLRHAWSRRFGVPHASLGMAAAMEAGLLAIVAAGLTLFADARGQGLFSMIDPRAAMALALAGLGTLWLVLYWLQRPGGVRRFHMPVLSVPTLLAGLSCYAVFLVCCAALLAGLAHVVGIDSGPFARLTATNAASWLAGFIVVGAPAGLGVREATFVALSRGIMDERHALLLIGLYRVATFLGDTLFMAAGAVYGRTRNRNSG